MENQETMLNGVHFYHATIKRIVSVFGTIFNNIVVGRHSGDKISNIMRVPISYGPRAKFLDRMKENLDQKRVAIKLPRMSFEITSIDYDSATKLNKLNRTLTLTANSPNRRTTMFQSVPYTLGMQLNIFARNQEDALQIVEQILPTFSPEYTVGVKGIEGPGSITDVPFILNSVTFSDDYEADIATRRTIIYSLDFTVRVRFAPDTSNLSIIKRVETEIADFTSVATNQADSLSTIIVSQDSPSDTIDVFTSLFDADDQHNINLAINKLTVSNLPAINDVMSVSIVSGAEADIDRIDEEDTNITLSGVEATGGSGSGATFNLVIDGRTGSTTSVTKSLSGLRFEINDTITIASSPYHNSPLVMEVTGVSSSPAQLNSPLSDSPYGEITTFNVTSGTGANPDTIANYSPTFIRNFGVDGGSGSGLSLTVNLNKTGAVTDVNISNRGSGYSTSDQISVSPSLLGEVDSPANSPTTPLVLNIDSVNDTTLNGGYIRNGLFNNKPKYTLNSPIASNSPNTEVNITYSGEQWQLFRNNELIGFNDVDTLTPIQSGWSNNILLTSNDTPNFTPGEIITGNSNLGRAVVISSADNVVVVKELETKYAEDEVLTGLTSGVTRTVFNMIINE